MSMIQRALLQLNFINNDRKKRTTLSVVVCWSCSVICPFLFLVVAPSPFFLAVHHRFWCCCARRYLNARLVLVSTSCDRFLPSESGLFISFCQVSICACAGTEQSSTDSSVAAKLVGSVIKIVLRKSELGASSSEVNASAVEYRGYRFESISGLLWTPL